MSSNMVGCFFLNREDIIGFFVFDEGPGHFRLGMQDIGDHDLTLDLGAGRDRKDQ